MSKIILAIVFAVIPTWVMAQSQERRKVVQCDRVEVIFRTVMEEFKERPVWFAQDLVTPTQYVITANAEQDTWTLIQYDSQQACVLGVGTGSRFPIVGTPV